MTQVELEDWILTYDEMIKPANKGNKYKVRKRGGGRNR